MAGSPSSVTDLFNLALIIVGEREIRSPDEPSRRASILKTAWDGGVRRAFLGDHHWNPAKTRIGLTRSAVAPAFGWTYAYEIPEWVLKVLQLNPTDITPSGQIYEVESVRTEQPDGEALWKRSLLTDQDEANITCIGDVDNVGLYTPEMVLAAANKLAVTTARLFGKSESALQLLDITAEREIGDAKGTDGQQGTPTSISSTDILDAMA